MSLFFGDFFFQLLFFFSTLVDTGFFYTPIYVPFLLVAEIKKKESEAVILCDECKVTNMSDWVELT